MLRVFVVRLAADQPATPDLSKMLWIYCIYPSETVNPRESVWSEVRTWQKLHVVWPHLASLPLKLQGKSFAGAFKITTNVQNNNVGIKTEKDKKKTSTNIQ